MPRFGERSLAALATAHPDLQRLFAEVVKFFDCTILEGHRGEEAQRKAVLAGKSKLGWPHSKHNRTPAMAVDAAPYPIDWKDTERFARFAGFVLGVASQMGIIVRWGGDWNMDQRSSDERFVDMPHFELLGD